MQGFLFLYLLKWDYYAGLQCLCKCHTVAIHIFTMLKGNIPELRVSLLGHSSED